MATIYCLSPELRISSCLIGHCDHNILQIGFESNQKWELHIRTNPKSNWVLVDSVPEKDNAFILSSQKENRIFFRLQIEGSNKENHLRVFGTIDLANETVSRLSKYVAGDKMISIYNTFITAHTPSSEKPDPQ